MDGTGRLSAFAQGSNDKCRASVHVAAGEHVWQSRLQGVRVSVQCTPLGFLQGAGSRFIVKAGEFRLLPDCCVYVVCFDNFFRAFNRVRAASSRCIRLTQFHLDIFDMGNLVRVIGDDSGRGR